MAPRIKRNACPVPFCTAVKDVRLLMCPACWRRVRRAERQEFRAACVGTDKEYVAAREKVIMLSAGRR